MDHSLDTAALEWMRGVALVAALLLGCVHDVYELDPLAPAPPPRPAEVRILVFGDFGYSTPAQGLVARAIRRESAAHPFDLAIQLGDNLYYCGPDPARAGADACRFLPDGAAVAPGAATDDPAFRRKNEAALGALRARDGGPLPMYLALGNHDVGWGGGRCAVKGLSVDEASRRRACLEVAHRSTGWTMPARHYVVDRGPVRLIVIDTNVAVADYGGFTLEDELAFVREAVAPCGGAGPMCFLVGHHPPAAAHGYRVGPGPSPFRARMARLVLAAGGRAVAFLGGHVHTLEHLSLGSMEVFVSGSTAMGGFMPFKVRTPAAAQVHFATSAWGYAILEADAQGWRVRFEDFQGAALHCCDAGRDGPCRPVECR
ncbi:metallophosphoesterase [Anaeromyxobacter oryzae]|uniref:metallophosphoesterase n=1 Tax=Anaeromyxobacter oryzae TaxID=2918170 RepID=UPI0020BF5EC5|nr:metallophosphoesterase [Anaeromyxobacter oryzae]